MSHNFGLSVEEERQLLSEARERRARQSSMVAQFSGDPAGIQRVADYAHRAPNASPGLIATAGLSGMPLEQFDDLAAQDMGHDRTPWSQIGRDAVGAVASPVTDAVRDVGTGLWDQAFKPFLRGAMALSQAGAEGLQRPFVAGMESAQDSDLSFTDAFEQYGQSPLQQGIRDALDGDDSTRFDLGTGILPGGESTERAMASRTLQVDGQQANFGRSLVSMMAGDLVDPGDRAYDWTAGIVQFAADVALDPVAWGTGGAAAAGRVARGFSGTGFGEAIFEQGVTRSAQRTYAMQRNVDTQQRVGDVLRQGDEVYRRTMEDAPERISQVRSQLEAQRAAGPVSRNPLERLQQERALPNEARQQALSELGLVATNQRRTVLAEQVEQMFRNDQLLDRLVQADAYDLMRSFRRSGSNRIGGDVIARLGRSTDKGEIAEILLEQISHGRIRDRRLFGGAMGEASVFGGGLSVKRGIANRVRFRDSKYAGVSPNGAMDAEDIFGSANKLDSLLRQANVGEDAITRTRNGVEEVIPGRREIFNQLAEVQDGDVAGMFRVTKAAMRRIGAELDSRGVTERRPDLELRTASGRTFEEALDETTGLAFNEMRGYANYASDRMGDAISPEFAKRVVTVDGVDIAQQAPLNTAHLIQGSFDLPSADAIRRAAHTSGIQRAVYNNLGWEYASGAARKMTRSLFKPLVLLRPAYIVRIGSEEQARLAAAGHDNILRNPRAFIMATRGKNREEVMDIMGGNLAAQARQVDIINKDNLGMLRDRRVGAAQLYDSVRVDGSTASVNAWRDELIQMGGAREMQRLAEFRGNIDDWAHWARNTSEGRSMVNRMARNVEGYDVIRTDDQALRQWGEAQWEYLQAKTVGDDELIDLIATGLRNVSDGPVAQANLSRKLRAKFDRGVDPGMVKRRRSVGGDSNDASMSEMFVAGLYDKITSKPSSYLARFPAYRQKIVQNYADMMPQMPNNRMRQDVIDRATTNMRLAKHEVEMLNEAAWASRNTDGIMGSGLIGGRYDLDDAKGYERLMREFNDMAIEHAAADAKDLMFDLVNRSAAQDAFDMIVPFWDAWKEIATSWGRLLKENPAFFTRAQQGFRSAHDQGAIYRDENGDMMFAYPGSETLTSFITSYSQARGEGSGMPGAIGAGALDAAQTAVGMGDDEGGPGTDSRIRMEGRVEGVNVVIQGIGPGFGPVVQWGAGAFIPDTPDFRNLREFINPFGTQGVDGAADLANPFGLAQSLMPAWYSKVYNAWTSGGLDEHQFNSMVGQAMSALAESGNYNPQDPDSQSRLIEDAERAGRWLMFLRGTYQAVGPTGPRATWELDLEARDAPDALPEDWNPEIDPEGRFFSIATLANEHRRLTYDVYDGDMELANQRFIEMYGVEPFYVSQARTRGLDSFDPTVESDTWVKRNQAFSERFPQVAGYFAPVTGEEDLDFGIWREQIAAGQRQSLNPEQQTKLATQTRLRAMLGAAERQLQVAGVDDTQRRRAMSQMRSAVNEQYPGWNDPVVGVQQRATNEQRIRMLSEALESDLLPADEPVVEPLRQYMALRSMALQQAERDGFTTLGGGQVGYLRDGLMRYGQMLEEQNPEFTGIWRQMLRREVEDA